VVGGPSAAQELISHGRFKDVALYRPEGSPTSFVLFLSGAGDWNRGAVDMAGALVKEGALVAGIDVPQFLANLEADGASCVLADGDLENLSHYVQGYARLPTYYTPILVGYSSGATLAYAMLAQAPANTFAGALSLGFCPRLPLRKALCSGEGLQSTPPKDGKGFDLLPSQRLGNPWIALHGEQDMVCPLDVARQFVAETKEASLLSLPLVGHGYSGTRNWLPHFLSAYRSIRGRADAALPPTELPDLPLAEVPGTAATDLFAVLLTGDGGWAGLDRAVAAALASRGIGVVAIDSLRYFWSPRTPDGLAADLERVIRHYAAQWKKGRLLLIGYSQGADVLPFAVNRLPVATRQLVARAAFINPGQRASFEFHLANWVRGDADGPPVPPEISRVDVDVLCLYGQDESNSACPAARSSHVRALALPGGHHFDGDYAALADRIMAGLSLRQAVP
jgi:type IV secretory pathway VirJ component